MNQDRQTKKSQFTETETKSTSVKIIAIASLVVVAAVAGWLILGQGASDGYAALKAQNGEVRIDLARVSDGQAHYFTHEANGKKIDFFVVKSVDGVMRAAFDACDVCYREKKGYRQEGNFMVCNNCGMKFRSDLVNEVKGGCNPAPLNRQVDGDQIVIKTADLAGGGWYFN